MLRSAVVRSAAVSGLFYPDDPEELRRAVASHIEAAPAVELPKLAALICPHAGYVYSGPTAGHGYRALAEQVKAGRRFERVVVLAPSHHVAFDGIAIPDCSAFATPLGTVPLSASCLTLAAHAPFVVSALPHLREHAIEVHLPFLQYVLGTFELIPLVFGRAVNPPPTEALVGLAEPRTLFVVSTDLSHYLSYDRALTVDRNTIECFRALDSERVADSDACGRAPASAIVAVARQLGWRIELLDYRNSGDTAGDRSRVVGYAAFALST